MDYCSARIRDTLALFCTVTGSGHTSSSFMPIDIITRLTLGVNHRGIMCEQGSSCLLCKKMHNKPYKADIELMYATCQYGDLTSKSSCPVLLAIFLFFTNATLFTLFDNLVSLPFWCWHVSIQLL